MTFNQHKGGKGLETPRVVFTTPDRGRPVKRIFPTDMAAKLRASLWAYPKDRARAQDMATRLRDVVTLGQQNLASLLADAEAIEQALADIAGGA